MQIEQKWKKKKKPNNKLKEQVMQKLWDSIINAKDYGNLNNVIKQLDLIDVYRTI